MVLLKTLLVLQNVPNDYLAQLVVDYNIVLCDNEDDVDTMIDIM